MELKRAMEGTSELNRSCAPEGSWRFFHKMGAYPISQWHQGVGWGTKKLEELLVDQAMERAVNDSIALWEAGMDEKRETPADGYSIHRGF